MVQEDIHLEGKAKVMVLLAYVALCICRGTMTVVVKVALYEFPPLVAAALRSWIAFFTFFLYLCLQACRKESVRKNLKEKLKMWRTWLHIFYFTFFQNIATQTFLTLGEGEVPAGPAGVVMAAVPLITACLSKIFSTFLDKKPITLGPYKISGVAVGFAGVVVVCLSATAVPVMCRSEEIGTAASYIFLVLAALSLAAASQVPPRKLRGIESPVIIVVNQLLAAPVLSLIAISQFPKPPCRKVPFIVAKAFQEPLQQCFLNSTIEETSFNFSTATYYSSFFANTTGQVCVQYKPWLSFFEDVTWVGWLFVFIMGLVNCVFSGLIYFYLIFRIGPVRTVTTMYTMPVMSLLLGVLLLGEWVPYLNDHNYLPLGLEAGGAVLVFAGLITSNIRKKSAADSSIGSINQSEKEGKGDGQEGEEDEGGRVPIVSCMDNGDILSSRKSRHTMISLGPYERRSTPAGSVYVAESKPIRSRAMTVETPASTKKSRELATPLLSPAEADFSSSRSVKEGEKPAKRKDTDKSVQSVI
uniref:EamA domain-containing protein n=1 Tax=Palpitomonas bilix TaxID=652834 RepID=A0A7S3GHV4_9EUKA|mmetsp:Transcript_50020/g.128734  ORF Transcript_50020/g.128734 Transcript_50020/m.128734 type:complete len:527 (+) Transcript_50020:263-1843(+)